jgi:hypothetical protein
VARSTRVRQIASGAFRADDALAIGYEIDFVARTATVLFDQHQGPEVALYSDERGSLYHVEARSSRRLYITIVDEDTIRVGPEHGVGVILRRTAG